jgi:hypothetical protein
MQAHLADKFDTYIYEINPLKNTSPFECRDPWADIEAFNPGLEGYFELFIQSRTR